MRDTPASPSFVNVAVSHAGRPDHAVAETTSALSLADTCFVLAFVPSSLDAKATADALEAAMAGVPVFGCTTAGQITPNGFATDALLLLAFRKANFRCASVLIEPLNPLSATAIAAEAQRHEQQFQHTAGWNRLALVLTDGVSKQEDLLVSTLETVLHDLPIFGGSAADGLAFEETFVLHKGQAHSNAALLLLLETNLSFQGLGFDHFLPAQSQLIITGADPEERLVYEINGAPAAEEYARLVGCRVEDLSPRIFSENPMLVQYDRAHYVRAISDATDGHALSFLAAIDDGLIMTLGQGQEILETLEAGLTVVDSKGRDPDFILGFDCVLRKLEMEQKHLDKSASDIMQAHRVVGFNTYGEQHCGLHMNQTFVGVAFFQPEERMVF